MRLAMMVALCLALALRAGPAVAHGLSGLQVREIVLAHDGVDTFVFVRQPLPLLFSDLIHEAMRAQTPLASPYLRLERTSLGAHYVVDRHALADDPAAFRNRLRTALVIHDGSVALTPHLVDFRITTHHSRPAFRDAATARAAMRAPVPAQDPAFGEAIAAYALRLPGRVLPTVQTALPSMPAGPALRLQTHLFRDRPRDDLHHVVGGPLRQATAFPATRIERASLAMRSLWQWLTQPGVEAP